MRAGRGAVAFTAVLVLVACAGDAATPEAAVPSEVGMLRIVADDHHGDFVDELRRQGFRLGTHVELLPQDPGVLYGDVDEAAAAVDTWVQDDVDLLIAFSTPFAQLVADLDADVPGLFVVNDPVISGLVVDERHPDRGMTGVTFRTPADRTLSLAIQALGPLTRVGYLRPADDPAVPGHREGFLAAADELGVEVVERSFAGAEDIPTAVAELAAAGVRAVAVPNSNTTFRLAADLERALDAARLPAIANTDTVAFAVVTLTPDGAELRRQLARQAARLLDGADVSSVPVEDPRKFTLIVNRTKARELGLPEIPDELLRQADVVR